ncbi:MAG: helix-hairpin-helix domain-containing protein, partial [Bacteroidales bacterium]|nr:helix-hairpin-helix domain-containing protein [Bacteroidales bacterium]
NQLKEVYGMTDTLYKKIKPHFIVKNTEPYRKINVNSQNIKELASHPYIDWYLAKEIILFRNNHGEIKDINMLKAVHLMNDSLFEKLRPYMDIK